MNDIKIFENPEFGSIRTVKRNSEPWFVAVDVCRSLELGNPSQAMTRLDVDEKSTLISNEGKKLNIVNEPGLYTLVLSSRKPEAKLFKRWITHEVLPSIRKTGGYNTDKIMQTMVEFMDRQQKFNQSVIELLEQQKAVVKAETYPEIGCATEETWLTATEVGRLLGMSKSMVGYIANLYGLKTPEYGTWFLEEFPASHRVRGVFRYNSRAIEQIKKVCKVKYTYP